MTETCRFRDQMIGRQNDHDGVGGPFLDVQGGKADAWCGIPAHGLDQDVLPGNLRQLAHQLTGMALTRHNENVFQRYERSCPSDRFLNNGSLRSDVQEVFGHLFSAFRPESGSFSTGHDNGVHSRIPPVL
jgi:hypothetical protein